MSDFPMDTTTTAGMINSPELTPEGKRKVRSVSSTGQARNIVKALIQYAEQRLIVNARIQAKLNAEKPHQQHLLDAEGLGWKANFTTKPLSQMADKAGPRFTQAAQGVKYLTNSALPPHISGATYKTEMFRKKLTDTVRAWDGWETLLDDVAHEDAIFGYTSVAWLDKYSWRPLHFRQDEFFIPKGTKQKADSAQVVIFKELYLPHELFEKIEDREAAEAAGFDLTATINEINRAMPENWRSRTNDAYRKYEDMFRELNYAYTYEVGTKVIEVYNVLVREVDGKVSHYRLAGVELNPIFEKLDRFDSMHDVSAFFSFQRGNGTMHGSKGIGREIYELAGIIDRNRNEIVDRIMLSGKTIIQTDDKNVKRFRMSVVGSAILIGRGHTVLETKIDGNVEPFLQLDSYLGLIVDQLVGNVSPRQLQGERVTKAQVDLFAQREEEQKDTKIERFLRQLVSMMGTIQKRILDPETQDEDAKALQKELLEIMSREELDMLRDAPVAGTVADLTPLERQQVVLIAQENSGNPLYNQRVLQEEKLAAQIDVEFAEKVLLPDEDPTVVAEQTRWQQLELALLMTGQAVPVSPRDNHQVHLGLLMPIYDQIGAAINQGQSSTAVLEVAVAHGLEHLNYAYQQGMPRTELAEVDKRLKDLQKLIAKLKQLDAQADSLGQAGQALQDQSAQEDQMAAQSLAVSTVPDTNPI